MDTPPSDDPIWQYIADEAARQESHLELIASENHTSAEVMAAMGTCLTDKYAEGYPGRRYYGGCEHVDEVERTCRERAKTLFGADSANVQAHSGTQANIAALMALVEPGEKVLAMSLDHGGHLSHGHPKNFSGVFYEFHSYGVDRETERLDMDRIREQALEVRPKLLMAGASAYSRTIDFEASRRSPRECGAHFMVDQAHIAGLVAAGVHPSPVPHADVVTMTTHKTLRGPRGGLIVCAKDFIRPINSCIFPRRPGGALHAHDRRQGDRPAGGRRAGLPGVRGAGEEERAHPGRDPGRARAAHRLRRDRQPPHAGGRPPRWAMTGADAEDALGRVSITCNKNLIPYDPEPPMKASGIRIGTAAVTSRGLGTAEMSTLGAAIADVLNAPEDTAVAERVRSKVAELTRAFPIRAAVPT